MASWNLELMQRVLVFTTPPTAGREAPSESCYLKGAMTWFFQCNSSQSSSHGGDSKAQASPAGLRGGWDECSELGAAPECPEPRQYAVAAQIARQDFPGSDSVTNLLSGAEKITYFS